MFVPRALVMMLSAATLLPVAARAQKTQLSLSGSPIAFPTPTAADFVAGQISSTGALLYTVNAQTGTTGQRTTNVYIRCAAPCPSSGTKSLATLKWRRADLGVWNTLATTDALVETRAMFKGNAATDPWSNSIYFQFSLGWTADPPSATQNNYNIIMTLTVTVP